MLKCNLEHALDPFDLGGGGRRSRSGNKTCPTDAQGAPSLVSPRTQALERQQWATCPRVEHPQRSDNAMAFRMAPPPRTRRRIQADSMIEGMTIAQMRQCQLQIRRTPYAPSTDYLANGWTRGAFSIARILASGKRRQQRDVKNRQRPRRHQAATPRPLLSPHRAQRPGSPSAPLVVGVGDLSSPTSPHTRQ